MFNRTSLALSLSAVLFSGSLYANSLIEQPLQLTTIEEPLKLSEAEKVKDKAKEAANSAKNTMQETVSEAKNTVTDKANDVKKVTKETQKSAAESKDNALALETPEETTSEPTTTDDSNSTATTKEPTKASTSNSSKITALNNANWSATANENMIAKAQVMLDNAYSPAGAIDGAAGQKTDKAIRAFQIIYNLPKTGKLDKATWDKLVELNHGQNVFAEYTISKADVDSKLYVSSMPADYGLKAKMKHLGYTRVSEMIAEKFHLDEGFLKKLNPNAKFVAGEKIIVANVHNKLPADITLIVAHKTAKQLYLFNSKNRMVGSFPATFGNDPKALVGEHTITGVARNPWYSYSPSNFVQGNNLKPLSLPPGPNGPVGNIWIGLSKKSFGIHGTPDPSKISTNNSHGCIRLSNWDANNLGNYVQKGVKVRFVD